MPSLPPLNLPPLQFPPGSPSSSPSSSLSPETSSGQSSQTAQMEQKVQQQINAIRQQQGLTELHHNNKLAEVARNYSRRMAEQDFFAHVGPEGDTLADRVGAAGIFYFRVGENLFTSTNIPDPVPAAVEGWMNSPGHRENILRSEYRETGIGIWHTGNTYYFTQLFMRSL
ncbi:MAG: CAP domain-containing protein [Elainella sp.]